MTENKSPSEIPTDVRKMTEQSMQQVRTAIDSHLQFFQRAVPGNVMGGNELSNKVLNYAERNVHQSASSMPPATAGPFMAAMTGFDSSSLVGPRGPRGAAPSAGKSRPGSGLSPSRLATYFGSSGN